MAGNLEPNYATDRKKRKLPTDELISYVEENPDAFFKRNRGAFWLQPCSSPQSP
jgi:hypothetical protein